MFNLTKKVVIVILIVCLIVLAGWISERMPSVFKATPDPAYALMCFSSGERVSGLYKICYYDCFGDTVAITIKSYQLCPLTINR